LDLYKGLRASKFGRPFLSEKVWQNTTFKISARYEVINDAYVFAQYRDSDISGEKIQYTHPFYRGQTQTLSFGCNFGF